jgi:O-antigen/teichoic acid export membrane protein
MLVPGEQGKVELSVYGAVVKIAAIMAMLIQAFKYAYEPIVFKMGNGKESKEYQAIAMKYFIAIALLAFLAVVFYMDILRHIIAPDYWIGLKVVPIVMIAEIIMGIYQNLSNWYKLNDETWWGAIFSTAGCAMLFVINILFVPEYGYYACAIASLIGFSVAMLLSYFVGQKRNPITYDLKSIFGYVALAAVLWAVSQLVPIEDNVLHLSFNTLLILVYIGYFVKNDLPVKQIPILKRFFK